MVQALLHDHLDFMKRLRKNGGARDELTKEGVELLSGVYDAKEALKHGHVLAHDEFLALSVDGD